MDVFSNFGLWGGGWTGWIIPFLFGLERRRLLPRARAFPGRALVRRARADLFHRFRTGARRLQRPSRHPLEARGHPARRLCEVFWRRECRERARSGRHRSHDPQERRESFFHQPVGRRAAIVAAGPIANFILAIVIFAASSRFYGKPDHGRAGRRGAAGSRGRRGRLPARRRRARHRRPHDRQLLRHAAHRQRQCRTDAGLRDRSRRRAAHAQRARLTLKQGKDRFGNNTCHARPRASAARCTPPT